MLTTVPPNILPLSGAKTNGKFVPAIHRKAFYVLEIVQYAWPNTCDENAIDMGGG